MLQQSPDTASFFRTYVSKQTFKCCRDKGQDGLAHRTTKLFRLVLVCADRSLIQKLKPKRAALKQDRAAPTEKKRRATLIDYFQNAFPSSINEVRAWDSSLEQRMETFAKLAEPSPALTDLPA